MKLLALVLLSLGVLMLSPFFGVMHVPLAAVLRSDWSGPERTIFLELRVPRACAAFLAGGGLSVCGLLFQSIFRNYLATPFTLGVSSGAALGAVIALAFSLSVAVPGFTDASIFALVGAMGTSVLVYGLSRVGRSGRTVPLLLAGIVLSYCLSNLVLLVQLLTDFTGLLRMTRWLMGGVPSVELKPLCAMAILTILGVALACVYARDLNLVAVGEEFAQSRGVRIERLQQVVFLASSLIVAGVVSFCGPLGFVGILEPFLCRSVFGHDHRRLLPASFLLGGALLTVCDTVARLVIAPAEVPVGVITGILGGPVFLWILMRQVFEEA